MEMEKMLEELKNALIDKSFMTTDEYGISKIVVDIEDVVAEINKLKKYLKKEIGGDTNG